MAQKAQKTIEPVGSLPRWARLGGRPRALQHVEVDAAEAYPDILAEIGAPDPPTAYHVEVARNFVFWDLLVAMRSRQLEIRIKDRERRWSLSNFDDKAVECPVCSGSNPSCRRCGGSGRMSGVRAGAYAARELYRKLRGFRPS